MSNLKKLTNEVVNTEQELNGLIVFLKKLKSDITSLLELDSYNKADVDQKIKEIKIYCENNGITLPPSVAN
jgi:hypothetical protein